MSVDMMRDFGKTIKYGDTVKTADGKLVGTYVSYFEKWIGDKALVTDSRGHGHWVSPPDLILVKKRVKK